VHVDRPDSLDRLDAVLVETRVISPQILTRVQQLQQNSGRLMGEILQSMGVLGSDKLTEALRVQLQRKVTRLFTPERARFVVLSQEHRFGAGPAAPGVEMEPQPLIYVGIRATYDEPRLVRALGPMVGTRVLLKQGAGLALREAGLPSADPVLAQLAQAGLTITAAWLQAPATSGSREEKALLLALHYLNLLRVEIAPPAMPLSNPFAGAPGTASGANPFGAVPTSGARPNPFAAAPGTGAGAPSSPGFHPQEPAVADPKALAPLAERMYRNGDVARAEPAFMALARAEPKSPRWPAFLARIRAWRSGPPDLIALDQAMTAFKKALGADWDFALGWQFLGEALKARGEVEPASRAFRAALRLDPTLVDCERELRLIAMRKPRQGR
jgi:hypothetical protein